MIRTAKAIIRGSWLGLARAAAAGCAREEPLKGTKALEFRLLANARDDADTQEAAKKDLATAREDPRPKEDARQRARDGRPPAPVAKATDKAPACSWVEVGRAERSSLHLDNAAETDPEHAAQPATMPVRGRTSRQQAQPIANSVQPSVPGLRTCTPFPRLG